MTAKHCFENVNVSNLRVIAGVSCKNEMGSSDMFSVSDVILHPTLDVALIRLRTNIPFNSKRQPISFIESLQSSLYNAGSSVRVSGWGWLTPNGFDPSNCLNAADVHIIENNEASNMLGETISNNELATTGVGTIRQGACHADSGGPLSIWSESLQKNILLGVVSWGRPRCVGSNLNSPSIFVRVSSIVGWLIQETTSISGPTTICDRATYTIENLPTGATIRWSVHPSLSIVSSTNNSIVVSRGVYPAKILTDLWVKAQTSDGIINKTFKKIVVWKSGITQTEDLIIGWLNEHGGEVQVAESIRDLGRNFKWSSSVNNWEPTMQGYYFTQFVKNGKSLGRDGTYITVEFDDPCGRKTCIYRQFNIEGQYPFSLSPNPATSFVTIQLQYETPENQTLSTRRVNKTSSPGVIEIQLWSATSLLRTYKTDRNTYQISVSDLPKGMYFVRVIRDGKAYTRKLIRK